MVGRLRFSALVGFVLGSLWGCATWTDRTGSPASVVESEAPESVRITLVDGSARVLEDPVVQGDSISGAAKVCGWVEGSDARACERTPVTLPLDRVSGLEVREVSVARTVGVIAFTGGVLWLLYDQTLGRGFTVFRTGF